MKKRLSRISPLQSAKTLAVLYFLISLPMLLVMTLVFVFVQHQNLPLGGVLLMLPLLYALAAFIGTLLVAWLYNLAAGWVGGIEVTISDQH